MRDAKGAVPSRRLPPSISLFIVPYLFYIAAGAKGGSLFEVTMEEIPWAPAENTAKHQRGRPFRPGRSGNPKGRPKGARNKTTLAMEALLDGESEAITRKLLEKAAEGDMTALRLCLDRLLSPRRDR